MALQAVDAAGRHTAVQGLSLAVEPSAVHFTADQLYQATISLSRADYRHSLYLELAVSGEGYRPGTVELAPGLADRALLLSVPGEGNTLAIGIASIGEAAELGGSRELATVELRRASGPQPLRPASAAPATPVNDLSFTGESVISWTYYVNGDYDQNGEVGISDITPVGVHFGRTSASPAWGSARVADGDGNGEVNAADITRIGLNFGSRVTSFVIRESAGASGPFESISAAVEFTDFPIPPGGGPRPFSYSLASPQPDHFYAVYARDGTQLADQHSNVVQYAGLAEPDIYTLDSAANTGQYTSAAVIEGGLLGVSYVVKPDIGDDSAYMIRSTTADAVSWFSPVLLTEGNIVDFSSLGYFDGFCYVANQVDLTLEITQLTGDGATRIIGKVIVGDGVAVGLFPSLAITDLGNIAVAHTDTADFIGGDINYARTTDSYPTFTNPLNISGGVDRAAVPCLKIVGGKPAVVFQAFLDGGLESLHFVRADDVRGNNWLSPVTLIPSSDFRLSSSCLLDNGSGPLVLYFDVGSQQLLCRPALDGDGLTWGADVPVASAGLPSAYGYSFAMVGGRPTAAYYDSADGRLKLVAAQSADGLSWGSPAVVYQGAAEFLSLVEFNGKAAIAFRDPVADSLKMAIYR